MEKKYLKEVLSPKIYNKYKNIEIETDDNGEILWQGEVISNETK